METIEFDKKDLTIESNQENNSIAKKKPRDIGIEILRIFAMFLISMVHLLNYGGFIKNCGGGNN